ncbi:MAG: AAA family ATPase, partial [Eggerthellaceae bacterium]|nr:AAA family ATPase [Eggerthellaceae bacterium]
MGIYLNPTNVMFQDTLNDMFYVDKTGLASFLNGAMGTPRKFVCVSRPRRFGKSVDADMLVAYYTKGADSRAQFAGLDVSRDPSFEKHLNAHDVIRIDAQRMILRGEGGIPGLPQTIAEKVIPEMRAAWPDAVPEGTCDLPEALELAFMAKGSGFVFVIDEWDCPMRLAEDDDGAQRRYLDFLRDLFKGAPYVEAAYMTGILPIRKYGMHSALNVFTEYSMTDPKRLANLTGFNADEVERLCERFGMSYGEMARWYDGYVLHVPPKSGPITNDTFGEPVHVYNPRSVAGAIANRAYSSYWTDTETYDALQRYIDIDFDGVAADLLAMLDGQRVPADVEGFANTMTDFRDKDDVYTLLVHLGYLGYDAVERAVFVPNEEVRREFVNALRGGGRPALARLARESR